METTTNYKLPQWVKADQIKMDDFNDAFGKIDAQMKKNADKANAAASAESVGTQITAVQEQIVAVEQEIKLVSLGEPRTTTAANGSIVYDLSALNMADYRAFLVFATVDAAGSGVSDKGRWSCCATARASDCWPTRWAATRRPSRGFFPRCTAWRRATHADAEPKRQLSWLEWCDSES